MTSRSTMMMYSLLLLFAALGCFVSLGEAHGHFAQTSCSKASWQVRDLTIKPDACPESRHLERGSSVYERGQGGRWSMCSSVLVCKGSVFSQELLSSSEQRLRQQRVGSQAPLQILQCSWLI